MKLENSTFTIYEVEEIKDLFEASLVHDDKIVVDLANVTKIDMSAIQLLISLKQTCIEKNKLFQIQNANDDILNAFNVSGVAYILGV